jgi:hypothetical protein
MSRGGSFDDFMQQFGSDLLANDVMIKRIIPNKNDIKGSGQISKAVVKDERNEIVRKQGVFSQPKQESFHQNRTRD